MFNQFSVKPFQFKDLSPSEFEHCVAFLLHLDGYKTIVRGGTGDEGVDVEARKGREFLVIQCKRYAEGKNIGSPVVQRLFGAIHANQANKGLVVTTSDFTPPARQYARDKPIDLLNHKSLTQWAKRHHIGPFFAPSPILEARKQFYRQLCQACDHRIIHRYTKGEDEFMNSMSVTLKEINFDELLWLRGFAQKHNDRLNIKLNSPQLQGGILDLEPRNAIAEVEVQAPTPEALEALIELITYFKSKEAPRKETS